MAFLRVLMLAYACAATAYWLAMIYAMWQSARRLPLLKDCRPPTPDDWPTLSIVVAACDEADNIEHALRSLLAQDYPRLQVVAVDDRSRDDTGKILDRIALKDPRLTVIHNRHLPENWLGKPHALQLGLARATGAWVLFTDADVEFRGPALRQAMAYALEHGLDHLAALPELYRSRLALEALLVGFLRQLCLIGRLWRVNDPRSTAFMGVGALNLVRCAAWDATGGFDALRLEIADDAGLGLLMRQGGGRQHLVNARGFIGLHWYSTFAQAARGCEKGFVAVGHGSFWRMVALTLLGLVLELSLVVLLLPLGVAAVRWAAVLLCVLFVIAAIRHARWSGTRVTAMLLSPLAAVVMATLSFRAAALGLRRGGIMWRGALYPSSLFQDRQRVRWF